MKAIFTTLKNAINRADFYYPMCDLGYFAAMREFNADKNRYLELCESDELSEEERENFRNLWNYKEELCRAEMSCDKEGEREFSDRYNSALVRCFGTEIAIV